MTVNVNIPNDTMNVLKTYILKNMEKRDKVEFSTQTQEYLNKEIHISKTEINKFTFEILNRYFKERYTEVKKTLREKLNDQMEKLSLVKTVLTNATFIAIMQLIVYAVMMLCGVPAPVFVDYFVVKAIVFTTISFFGYYFKRALFKDKNSFKHPFLATVFFAGLYQIKGLLIL